MENNTKILQRKPITQKTILNRDEIKYRAQLRAEISQISDIDFIPAQEYEYEALGEPYSLYAAAEFKLRAAIIVMRKKQLIASAGKPHFTKSAKVIF